MCIFSILQDPFRHESDIGAFYVTLQNDVHVYTAGRVMFDTLVYSPGNDFSFTGGYYTCPVDGTYVFMSTITAAEQFGAVSFWLKRSGETNQPKVIPRNVYSQIHSGSGVWIIQCQAANHVYLEVSHDNNNGSGLPLKGDGFTMFSGFLLTQS